MTIKARRSLTRLGRFAVIVVALVSSGAVLAERPAGRDRRLPPVATPSIAVFVVYDALHSDIVIPTAMLQPYDHGAARAAAARLAPAAFVGFGWGDARFYRGEGFGVGRALDVIRAAFRPGNPSTVHVQRSSDPRRTPPGWAAIRLRVTPNAFNAMVRRLDTAFVLNDGRPIAIVGAASPNEVFYEGRGAFSLANDCNQWIGALVGASGSSHNALLDTTSWGLALDLKLRAGAVTAPKLNAADNQHPIAALGTTRNEVGDGELLR